MQKSNKSCPSRRDDLRRFQLLYKDDSEYNECYAENWEDSFKISSQTPQNTPAESPKCTCVLPCDKVTPTPKREGSYMELPWEAITLPERCDVEPTQQKAAVEENALQCSCKAKQSIEEQKPADERKLKCICKVDEKPVIEEQPKCICEEQPKCICKQKTMKPLTEELKPKCNCTQKPVVEETKPRCTCTKPVAEEQPKLKCGCVEKPAAEEKKPKCTCRKPVAKAPPPKLTCTCKLQKAVPREIKPVFEEPQPKCICDGKPLESVVEELPMKPSYEQKRNESQKMCTCGKEPKPKCTCAKFLDDDDSSEEPSLCRVKEMPSVRVREEQKPECTCKLSTFEEKPKPVVAEPKCTCKSKQPKPVIEQPALKCQCKFEEPKKPIVEELKCTCKSKQPKTVVEEPAPKCQCKSFKPPEEPKQKCNCQQKPTKPLLEETKPKCICGRKPAVVEPKPKCTCEEKPPKPVVEEPKPKCVCEEKPPKPVVEEPKPKCICEEQSPKPVVEEPKPKCICEQKSAKPLVEESKPKCICEQEKPVVEESSGKCSCKQQTQPSFAKEQIPHTATQETVLICECTPDVRKLSSVLPQSVSEDSKRMKPVIKTFTCPGKKASRDMPTRIPIPIVDLQKPSRAEEDDEEVDLVKPPEKEQEDDQQPPMAAQRGICDCDTYNTKPPAQKVTIAPLPESNLSDENVEQSTLKSGSEPKASDADGQQGQRDDPDQNNGDPGQENASEAPTSNNEDASQRPEGINESQAGEQSTGGEGQAAEESTSGEGQAGGSGTGGDGGEKPSEKDGVPSPCQCSKSRSSMDEEQRCLEESQRNPMKLVFDNMCYEANEPYMEPLSKIYPDDCETYCGPSTEIPWSEILIPKGVKLRQAKKPKKEKFKATSSTNTESDISKRQ